MFNMINRHAIMIICTANASSCSSLGVIARGGKFCCGPKYKGGDAGAGVGGSGHLVGPVVPGADVGVKGDAM